MTDKKKKTAYFVVIGVLILATIIAILVWSTGRSNAPTVESDIPQLTEPDRRVVVKEVDRLVEVEKEFTSQILQDGLRDMGVLITQEYYFTEVMSYSSVKSFLNIDIPITESSYIASYDGVVAAGIDFRKIKVEKDDSQHQITVYLPKSQIQNISIDPDTFTLYQEKTGVGNRVSISDYNTSLSELEKAAREKAIDRGVLEQADINAQKIVSNFVNSLTGQDYSVVFKSY